MVQPIEQKIRVAEQENRELTKLRDWLLPVLMNGQATVEWGEIVQLLKYMEAADLAAKTEVERAKLLCFYHFKEDGETAFIMSNISAWMEECSFSKPNTSRLKTNLTKGKGRAFLGSKANKNAIEFVPTVLQTLERDYGALWTDTVTIESHYLCQGHVDKRGFATSPLSK